jgi:hypothetical protein
MAILTAIKILSECTALGRLMLSLLVLSGDSYPSMAQPTPEYQVKAAFLFNFTQFIEWPSHAFHAPDAPLIIGLLGNDPFGPYLDEMVAGEVAGGHRLIVQRFDRVEDVKVCHILFISSADRDQLRETFDALKKQPVLTVGDGPNFARTGGMIRFYTEENRIRIRINLDAAKEVQLNISSKLLRMADIVSTK